jgi:hypothetical protein
MFRGREILKTTALTTLTLVLLLTGCIFSPSKEDVRIDPPAPEKICKPDDLIKTLEFAYRERLIEKFAPLLANDPEHKAEYIFRLADDPTGQLSWGYTEEVRIHRRMFDPANPQPGEPEVPTEYWLTAIDISLSQVTPWTERNDLYFDPDNPDLNPNGLDKNKWKALDSRFSTHVFFDTQTDNDFLVEGEAIFVVIEDLEKTDCAPGQFLLLEWKDIDVQNPKPAVANTPS